MKAAFSKPAHLRKLARRSQRTSIGPRHVPVLSYDDGDDGQHAPPETAPVDDVASPSAPSISSDNSGELGGQEVIPDWAFFTQDHGEGGTNDLTKRRSFKDRLHSRSQSSSWSLACKRDKSDTLDQGEIETTVRRTRSLKKDRKVAISNQSDQNTSKPRSRSLSLRRTISWKRKVQTGLDTQPDAEIVTNNFGEIAIVDITVKKNPDRVESTSTSPSLINRFFLPIDEPERKVEDATKENTGTESASKRSRSRSFTRKVGQWASNQKVDSTNQDIAKLNDAGTPSKVHSRSRSLRKSSRTISKTDDATVDLNVAGKHNDLSTRVRTRSRSFSRKLSLASKKSKTKGGNDVQDAEPQTPASKTDLQNNKYAPKEHEPVLTVPDQSASNISGKTKRSMKDFNTRSRSLNSKQNSEEETLTTFSDEFGSPARSLSIGMVSLNHKITVNDHSKDFLPVFDSERGPTKTLDHIERLMPDDKPSYIQVQDSKDNETSSIPSSLLPTPLPSVTGVQQGTNTSPAKDMVVQERHWGIRVKSRSHLSEATWIPTEEERYKLAGAFVAENDEDSNEDYKSDDGGALSTDLAPDSVSSAYCSDATGSCTVITEGVVTTVTDDTGITEGTGGYSEYTDGIEFASSSNSSGITDNTSRFDLTLDGEESTISPEPKRSKRRKKKTQKSLLQEVISDLKLMVADATTWGNGYKSATCFCA